MSIPTETRARIITGIDPSSTNEAYLVLAFSPENDEVRQLLDSAYEGDGAFYISTSDAWVAREEIDGRLLIRVERPTEDGIEIMIEASCPAPEGSISEATVAVQSNEEWDEITAGLHSGESPVIFGPKP